MKLFDIKKMTGFSLTELMVTVSLLGVIGALTIPIYRKRIAKSRRNECLTMLSDLRNTQELYFNTNRITYNAIHCPKPGSALNTRDVGGSLKNVLTVSNNISDKFCDYISACNQGPPSGGTSSYCNTTHTRTVYQYAFRACAAGEVASSCPSNIADGAAYFPLFPTGSSNVFGFSNPTGNPSIGSPAGLLPASNKHGFIVQCRGNIDEDTTAYDVVAMDHAGTVSIVTDDVN